MLQRALTNIFAKTFAKKNVCAKTRYFRDCFCENKYFRYKQQKSNQIIFTKNVLLFHMLLPSFAFYVKTLKEKSVFVYDHEIFR